MPGRGLQRITRGQQAETLCYTSSAYKQSIQVAFIDSFTNWRAWLSPRRVRFWLLAGFAAYSLAGFLLVPWLLQRELPSLAQQFVKRDVTVERFAFNPWTLTLSAEDLRIHDTGDAHADKNVLLAAASARVDLQTSSAWQRAIVLGEISLVAPELELIRDSAGLNLARFIGDLTGDEAAEPGASLRLVIEQLRIENGAVKVTDKQPATPFVTQLTPINIDVRNLSTLENDLGSQVVRIVMEDNGRLDWTGSLQLSPLASAGRIDLDAPLLELASRYLSDQLQLNVEGGRTRLGFNYQLTGGADGSIAASINGLSVAVAEAQAFDAEAGQPLLSFAELKVQDVSARWPNPEIEVGAVSLTDPSVDVTLNESGALNWLGLWEVRGQTGSPAAVEPADEIPARDSILPESLVALSVEQLGVVNATARFTDGRLPDAPELMVGDGRLTARNLSNAPNKAGEFEAQLSVGSGGELRATGDLSFSPRLAVAAKFELADTDITAAGPWVSALARVGLESGELKAKGRVATSPEEPLALRGDFTLDDLSVSDSRSDTPLVGWQRLRLDDLSFQLAANQLELSRIRLNSPFVRIQINADRTNNFSGLAAENASVANPAPSADADPFVIKIGETSIADGRLDFADLALPLPFRTDVRELNGKISAFASNSRADSNIALDGSVGEFGRADVSGAINVIDPLSRADVRLVFRNVNFPDLSPYTVDFAGRKIDSGKLNLDLAYSFDEGQMVGENAITIEKIKLGDKVASPNAADLPLGLAVALLSDLNGVMDLKVNIKGDVGDPSFSARGVFVKALANVLAKAATSPFSLLASVAGVGGDGNVDLQQLQFEPGRSRLTGPEREKLLQLAGALAQRPRLVLRVPGVYAPDADSRALLAVQLETDLEAALEKKSAGGDDAQLTARRLKALEAMTRQRLPDASLDALRAPFIQPAAGDVSDVGGLDEVAYSNALRSRLIEASSLPDTALTDLASARAKEVMEYLRNQDPGAGERVVSAETQSVEAKDGRVGLKLAIDTR